MNNKIIIRLLGYLKKYKMYVLAIMICSVISNVFNLMGPILIGKSIDHIISKGHVEFNAIIKILTVLAILYGISALFQWLFSIFINIVSNNTVKDIRNDAFDKISKLPLSFFDGNAHGDIISRLTNDIDFISDGLIQGSTQIFSGIIIVLGSLFFMLSINPVITLVVLIITPLCFLIASFIARMSKKMFREQTKTIGELNGYIEEIIGNQKVVKAFNYEERSQQKFAEINQRLYNCGYLAQFYSALTNPSTRFVNNTAFILVGAVGSLMAIAGRLTIGNISSFLTYSTQFSKPINDITSVATQIQAAAASAERVFALIDMEPEKQESSDIEEMKKPVGNVSFDDVYFSYKKDVPLIQDLNINIKSGNTIAIVGPTGAGKTTIVNLLMRFYDINKGSIKVDGKDINSITRNSLRKSFGMVLQDSWLFSGTIRDNITYGKPDATEEEILNAAKASYADSFIKRMPNGYDTVITEDGGNLSQGQKQLLTIARVMLIDPPMLILDEATSNIDTLTEIRIQKAFNALMKGRTSFIIAHRLSTIREADLILVMNSGRIIEQGTHKELLQKNGFYAKLYNSQFCPTA